MNLICCNNVHADFYCKYLMKQKVHFAIIFLEEDIKTLKQKFSGIMIFFYNGDSNMNINDEKYDNVVYDVGFLIQETAMISHSILLKYEKKLHNLIPEEYHYCFSYHKENPFFRSWPIYMKVGTKSNIAMVINPYEKEEDNLIILPLLYIKAIFLKARGYIVEFYHYFEQGYELGKIFLKNYQNFMFLMKETDMSIMELHDNSLVQQMKTAEIISLENVLAASKELKYKEVSRFLAIDKTDLCIDLRKWKLPGIGKPDIKGRNQNIIFCFDGVDEIGEHLLSVLIMFEKICRKRGKRTIKVTRDKNCYYMVGDTAKKWSLEGVLSLISEKDLYIGTDSVLAHMAGLLDVPNYLIMENISHTYNPPLRRHTVLKVSRSHINLTPDEIYGKVMLETEEIKRNKQVSIEQYGTYQIIEL